MTRFPYRGTYKKTPRARKEQEVIFFAVDRQEAFRYLCDVVERETFGDGIIGYVDALTCAEAHARRLPFTAFA